MVNVAATFGRSGVHDYILIRASAIIILAPKLGTALTFSLIVLGQMSVSLVLDHFGLLGLPVKAMNIPRLVGVSSLILGVILIRRF